MEKIYTLPDGTHTNDPEEIKQAVYRLELEITELFPKYRLVGYDFTLGHLHVAHREFGEDGQEVDVDTFQLSVKGFEALKDVFKKACDAWLQPLFDPPTR